MDAAFAMNVYRTTRVRLGVILLILLATSAGCTRTSDNAAAIQSEEVQSPEREVTTPPPPEDTEVWEPEPEVVTPGLGDGPPSDAVVLFDGTDLSGWKSMDGEPAAWRVEDGAMTVVAGTGNIRTIQGFGDVQLHIEWRTPAEVVGEGQGRGNSGVYFMERYELQVLDSYENRTYSNGQAGAIYKQHIPMVNASRPPGEWQSYDVIFTAPRFGSDGELLEPAYVTAFHNGVLIQNHVALRGSTMYEGEPRYEAHGDKLPLMLQDHDNPVSYRNVWVREVW